MKIIDLLVKIANKEEVPKKIKYSDIEFEYNEEIKFYYNNGFSMYRAMFFEGNCLNDEIEIIEDKPKKIEKLKLESWEEFKNNSTAERYHKKGIEYDTINDLANAVNYLLEKESDE